MATITRKAKAAAKNELSKLVGAGVLSNFQVQTNRDPNDSSNFFVHARFSCGSGHFTPYYAAISMKGLVEVKPQEIDRNPESSFFGEDLVWEEEEETPVSAVLAY